MRPTSHAGRKCCRDTGQYIHGTFPQALYQNSVSHQQPRPHVEGQNLVIIGMCISGLAYGGSRRKVHAGVPPVSCASDAWGEQCCKRVCVPPRGERGLPTDPEAVNRRAFSAWCGTVRVKAPTTRCAARKRLQRKPASGGRSASNAVIRLVSNAVIRKR